MMLEIFTMNNTSQQPSIDFGLSKMRYGAIFKKENDDVADVGV